MIYSVFDIEADDLLNKITKIHCLSYQKFKNDVLIGSGSFTNYGDICDFVLNEKILVGHNIIRYDIPALEKILNIKITAKLIDTLGLSWYLYPNRIKHGLDEWGHELGIAKPPITNWLDLPVEEYVHRCLEDVRINVKLWHQQLTYLKQIYNNDNKAVDRIIGYLSFKLDCAKEQEEVKLKLNRQKCEINLALMIKLFDEKTIILSKIMPKHTIYKIKEKPKVMYKKDGSVSKLGEDWFALLKEMGLPDYHNGALKLVKEIQDGNPGSPQQLKDWVFGLGWKPITFKYVRDPKDPYGSEPREIPQMQSDDDTGLCESVKDLFEVEPKLEELEEYFLLRHRRGIFKAFLDSIDENDMLKAEISGFTNTLRMQHKKPLANLPGNPKLYWEEVRSCLIARDNNHILCGSDMSSLEDSTKRHYMYFYDPEYVKEMSTEGFDNHLDIAIRAGLMTKEEVEWYKNFDKKIATEEDWIEYNRLKALRLTAKKTNFSAVYGAGGPKIAVTAKVSVKEGYTFHKVYWGRNWSVKKVADNTIHKTVNGQMWLYNPISQFWYSLRFVKDKFSTLNQGTGVYAFDMWTKFCREGGHVISMQYHDEHLGDILKTEQEKTRTILLKAIDKVNEKLKLNVKLGISIDFGNDYASVH